MDTVTPIGQSTSISFSGYQWTVRENASRQGPGPNYFRQQQVWVDAHGWLHLLLSKDSTTGNWLAAEITSQQNFGFGLYQFLVDGRPDRFDKNIVLGFSIIQERTDMMRWILNLRVGAMLPFRT